MIIKDMPASERPREKMLRYGPKALSNAELIAAIIGSGTKRISAIELAQRILALDHQGLGYLGRCSLDDILAVDGIGSARGCQLMAAVELGKRLAELPMQDRKLFSCQKEIADYFMSTMRYLSEEHLMMLLLDSQGHMIAVEEVGIGSLLGVEAHPREIFHMAIKKKAAAIIVAHNHPSGDCTPSQEDKDLTNRLGMAGEIIGIPLLDHIVIGDGTYASIQYEKEKS